MQFKTLLAPAAVVLAGTVFAQPMDEQYNTWPTYSGDDLELLVDNSGTHFTLWSPKADAAEVLIYNTDRNTPATEVGS